MRQLFPDRSDVDPLAAYLAADRTLPVDRPWVAVGMISSLDGATVVDGTSGDLGGPADQQVLRAVRGIADAVVVGAGTVRAEGYGPVRISDAVAAARTAVGRDARPPRLVIVTGSLDLDPESPALRDAPVRPLVCTTVDADEQRAASLAPVADIHRAGTTTVDLASALRRLRSDGARVAVCEGGPSLNGAMVDAGVVDEWIVTLAPRIVGGDSSRIVAGAESGLVDLELASLLVEDDLLFGRWTRPRH